MQDFNTRNSMGMAPPRVVDDSMSKRYSFQQSKVHNFYYRQGRRPLQPFPMMRHDNFAFTSGQLSYNPGRNIPEFLAQPNEYCQSRSFGQERCIWNAGMVRKLQAEKKRVTEQLTDDDESKHSQSMTLNRIFTCSGRLVDNDKDFNE